MSTNFNELPVVVIGAGPVGLATAAHLRERGLTPLVLEAGATIGAAIEQWGHTRLFSPWQYDIDSAARRLLEPTGWTEPDPDALPTGHELIKHYLAPLAKLLGDDVIRTGARVVAVSREGIDKTRSAGREQTPFLVRVQAADSPQHPVGIVRQSPDVVFGNRTAEGNNPVPRQIQTEQKSVRVGAAVKNAVCGVIFLAAVACIVSSSYNPFIYFAF